MRELERIIEEYEGCRQKNTASSLATVVHVQGSSYRRAGARMLVDEFGTITGAISGGCLEGDALRKALLAMHQQKNKLVTYDTSDEDDAVIGAQLGCNGIIQVLFEPIDYEDAFNPCELLKKAILAKESCAIAIQFNLNRSKNQPGTILRVRENSEYFGKHTEEKILQHILKEAQIAIAENKSVFTEVSIESEFQHVFIQKYQTPLKLILVGAGNDAQVLSRQAEVLGWEVIVADGRPTHANKQRFASSCQIIVSKPEKSLENIPIDHRSCFVLMSHNYRYDLAVLKLILNEDKIPYIGILGPLKKYRKMQKDLQKSGYPLTKENTDKIYAPIGLELGGETPAEIGLSILSEIQSVITKSSAKPLREKLEPIHKKEEKQFKQVKL